MNESDRSAGVPEGAEPLIVELIADMLKAAEDCCSGKFRCDDCADIHRWATSLQTLVPRPAPQAETERMRELAWVEARRRHNKASDDEGIGCTAGHAGSFIECAHEDCKLVRVEPSAPRPSPAPREEPQTIMIQRIIKESIEDIDDAGPAGSSGKQFCRICENDTDTELHAPECPILKLTQLLGSAGPLPRSPSGNRLWNG